MRSKCTLAAALVFWCILSEAQPSPLRRLQRPKLIIGIVVDQMRWDFLYRYFDEYGPGGFRRLLDDGYSCNNVRINYLPSYTAVGHTCIFSGSIPALSGISGNDWIDQRTGKHMYCVSDPSVFSVGGSAAEGRMSPRNLLVSTVTDELRIATNNRSRVVGISLKDRAAILPAGHAANAAFWYDDSTANFISSTYYLNTLPDWVVRFNEQHRDSSLLAGDWNLLRPLKDYIQSTADSVSWEGLFSGETAPVFPHRVHQLNAGSKDIIRSTPFGNTLTLEFAKAAIEGYRLGMQGTPDFLTINCASTDYVGHKYGPNSMEIEDTYLRLDLDLASFFKWLDGKLGKGNYLVMLTADHGVAHAIGFMHEEKLPAEAFSGGKVIGDLNRQMKARFGVDRIVKSELNYQVNLDLDKIAARGLNLDSVMDAAADSLRGVPGILYAVNLHRIEDAALPEPIRTMVTNGYYAPRSGQIQIILDAGWFEGSAKSGTTHGGWNPYDAHIPLIFMGWHIRAGSDFQPYWMTDIAPTIAALLHIQAPSANIGNPIVAVVGK
jgi:predicted AlkP superfamily pyrophosphatase or phosphodiesterase